MHTAFIRVVAASVVCAWLGGCSGAGNSGSGREHSSLSNSASVQHAKLENAHNVFTEQRRGDWCWAACCEMALKYNGVNDVTQEILVQRFKGSMSDQTAIDGEIILALATDPPPPAPSMQGVPQNHSGAMGQVKVDLSHVQNALWKSAKIYSSSDSAVEDFAGGHPVLLGLKDWEGAPAHIVFVTAIEYVDKRKKPADTTILQDVVRAVEKTVDDLVGNYRYEVVAIEFYDPMPETGGVTRLEAADLDKHFRFYLSRKRAREIIHELESTMQVR